MTANSNPNLVDGQKPDASVWNNAFAGKVDAVGGEAALTSVTATGASVSRALGARFADVVNIKDFGAIGDGNSHPLSGITSFNGSSTTGWTLLQWQAIFPFATATSNELDQCAILLAIQTAATQHRTVYVPGGRYQCNFAPSVTVNGAFKFEGGGMGVTCLEVTNTSATALPLTIAAGTSNNTLLIDLYGFSVYPTHTSLGGNGIVITGTTAASGRPDVRCHGLTVGVDTPTPATSGAFAVGIQVNTVGTAWLIDCNFLGSQNTALGSPNNLSGTGFQIQGNSTFYSFGPIMVNCAFSFLNQSVVIGNGTTTAYTQGASFTQCGWDDCNYCIVWRSNNSSVDNDYLNVESCNLAFTTTGIWTDTVLTHTINNTYFLGYSGSLDIRIDNTGSGNAIAGSISANTFIGYGGNGQALQINGGASQSALTISGNSFFDFSGASAPAPVALASGTSGFTLTDNVFRDNNALPSDLGTNNRWYNTTVATSTGQHATMWLTGVPTAAPTDNGNVIVATGASVFLDSGRATSISSNGSTVTVYAPTVYLPAGGITVAGTTYLAGTTEMVGPVSTPLSTKTGTSYSVGLGDYSLILNPSSAFTLTLPTASTLPGRTLTLKLIAAFAVSSASSNVVPLAGGSAGTAILTGTAGKFCVLQSDGTNWQIMQAN